MFVALEDKLFVFERGRKTNSCTRGRYKMASASKTTFWVKNISDIKKMKHIAKAKIRS